MAQLSTGSTTSEVFRTGNRAQMGDFGLYLGMQTSIFKDLFDGSVDLLGTLPLLNLKYMMDDKIELRVGLDLYRSSKSLNGTWEDGGNDYGAKSKIATARNFIYPGVAYHFSSDNLLDVYIGAELPIGWNRDKTVSEASFGSDKAYSIKTKTSFHAGIGAFVGLQAYIANLPIAVGVEYGVAFMSDWNLKYKNETKLPGQKATISYTPDHETFPGVNTYFDSLNARQSILGSQIRLTITYFFTNY